MLSKYWKSVKLSKHLLARSCIAEIESGGDGRPQANIEMNGNYFTGLMDSGTHISCFGRGGKKELDRLGLG